MRYLSCLLLSLSLLLGAANAFSQDAVTVGETAIPILKARVTDLTGTLAAAEQQALEQKLAAFEQRKGSQLAVLIVPNTGQETIEQFGIRVANYPLTEEDLDDNRLPKVLREHKNKLFGLMIDAERLVAIRNERKANSRYASFSQCQMELRAIEGIYISEGIKYLNVTEMSIEEISTRILQATGLKRRIG